MSNNFKQRGFVPPLIIILFAIIAVATIIVVKNLPLNQPQPNYDTGTQRSNNAQVKPVPSPTPSKFVNIKISPTNSPAKIGSLTSTPTPTPSGNSNNSNSNPTLTLTPTPTSIPTTTPTPNSTIYSVKITNPRGGETIKVGDTIHITWETTGTFSAFGLDAIDTYNNTNTMHTIGTVENPNARSYDWVVNIGSATTPRQVKIDIIGWRWQPQFSGNEQASNSSPYFTVTR